MIFARSLHKTVKDLTMKKYKESTRILTFLYLSERFTLIINCLKAKGFKTKKIFTVFAFLNPLLKPRVNLAKPFSPQHCKPISGLKVDSVNLFQDDRFRKSLKFKTKD
jgi:hypothetical protein